MIALTKEKREELKVTCEQIISGWIQVSGYGMNERIIDIAEIALASLTSGPIYQEKRFFESRGELIEYWDDINKSTYIHESQRRALYTAPPVPEIKFPDLLDIPDGLDLTSAMAAIYWYEMETKRLNGLGE